MRRRITFSPALDRILPAVRFLPPVLSPLSHISHFNVLSFVRSLEDRRRFRFDTFSAPRSVTRGAHRVVLSPTKPGLRAGLSFFQPKQVSSCVRRKQRREVIFAKGRSGGGPRRRPKFNHWSRVSC